MFTFYKRGSLEPPMSSASVPMAGTGRQDIGLDGPGPSSSLVPSDLLRRLSERSKCSESTGGHHACTAVAGHEQRCRSAHSTLRRPAAKTGTLPLGVRTEACVAICAGKKAGVSLECWRARATQRLAAHGRRSATMPGRCDPPTADHAPGGHAHDRPRAARNADYRYQCSRRCRALQK